MNEETFYAKDSTKDMEELIGACAGDRFEFHLEIKEVSEEGDKRLIAGYANTKNLDRMNEIVEPTAFKNTIKEWMKNPVILRGHDPNSIIGRGLEAKIDSKGLWIKAEIASDTEKANETWALIKQKMLKAFSIGYQIIKDEVVERAGKRIRRILDLDLLEVSVLGLPANRESLFDMVKGMQYGTDLIVSSPAADELPTDADYEETREYIEALNVKLSDELAVLELQSLNKKLGGS